ECWKWLSAAIFFAEGYLYQRAFAHIQAFESFGEGMATYKRYLESDKKDKNYKSLTIVENEVAQGKIFIELGRFKSALNQFLKALSRVFVIAKEGSNDKGLDEQLNNIKKVIDLLESARQDVIFYKKKFNDTLKKFEPDVLFEKVFHPMRLLTSDICARIGFVLYLLFYRSEEAQKYAKSGVGEWMEVALKLDANNGLAQFNRMLSGTKKKISTAELNFRNDSSIRRFIAYALETLVNSPNHQELEEERDFFKKSITYSDSLVKKPLEINYYLSPDKKKKRDGLLFLKRWSSSSPRVPRPTTFKMRGGGYIVFWNNKGIVIDPGFDFITNLYSEGFSISDIDAVIVTHDHIDHTDDFDAILALNYQLNRYNESTYLKPKNPINLSLFLNTGFMEKYTPYLSLGTKRGTGVNARGDGYIDHIYTLAPHSTIDMTDTSFQFKIEVIPARHREITLDKYAVGFKLHLYDKGERRASLGFTSDTAYFEAMGNKFKDCEIVIPHIGFVTFRELGQLLELEIDKIIKSASSNYFSDIEEELRFFSALGFRDVKSWEDLSTKWTSGGSAQHQGFLRQHLGYSGVKKIWQKMADTPVDNQLMIISELHEEMGSFRSKLASTFNKKAQKVENAPLSLTSDIGLHLSFSQSKNKFETKIQCESCARDNDLDIEETFHDPQNIKEVCVKGENEGIFYFCKEHAPDPDTEFREKVDRFKLFG
ncbi:MAG: MBL fold metallo-hydrolase, partial [Actinobacteria bacterium]